MPTYRDGDGLWKRYDAMEASQISRTVWKPLGNPPNVMEFPGENGESESVPGLSTFESLESHAFGFTLVSQWHTGMIP